MIRKTVFVLGCAIFFFVFGASNGFSQSVTMDANGFEVKRTSDKERTSVDLSEAGIKTDSVFIPVTLNGELKIVRNRNISVHTGEGNLGLHHLCAVSKNS